MRKLLIVLLTAALIAFMATPAYAQARYSLQSASVETQTVNVVAGPVWVYGISIYADAGNSFMAVFDVDTLAELQASTTPKDEIGEATQYDTADHWYPKPVYYSQGVSVVMWTGVGFIHYGPPPTE